MPKHSFTVVDGGMAEAAPQASSSVTMSFGDEPPGGGPPVDAETQRYVDKSMETVRAQNDARFAEVLSRIDIVSVKIDHAPRPLTVLQFLLGSAGALAVTLGVVFAVLAYASDRFDGGLAATAVVDKITSDQLARDSAQDAKLDQIIEAVGNLQPASNSKP